MRRLVTAIIVVAGLVLTAACGSGDGDRRATKPLGGGLALSVEPDPDPPRVGKALAWMFSVENNGVEAVELSFGSSQRGDVVLKDGTKVVYRWSKERMFSTAVHEELLRPNRTLRFALEEEILSVPAGRYTLEAILSAKPEQEPYRKKNIEVK